jgi:hypothetical protein
VIKGPVASAGSILFLCKINGINVPIIAAKTTTTNREILTTNPSVELAKIKAIP